MAVEVFKGKKFIDEITRYDAELYANIRLQKVAPVSVKKEVSYLEFLFNRAVRWGYLKENQFAKLACTIKFPDKEVNTITVEEEERLISAIYHNKGSSDYQKIRQHAMILLAVQAGLRSQEIQNLRIKDIDFSTGKVEVKGRRGWQPKSKKNRTVYVDDEAIGLLKKLKKMKNADDEFKPFWYKCSGGITTWFTRLRGWADVKCTFHDLRKTCASRMAEAGVPVQVVKEIMGHHAIEITLKYYTKIREESLKEGVLKTIAHAKRKRK